MNPMTKRILVSIPPIMGALYAVIFAPYWIFVLTIEIFTLAGVNEFLNLVEKKGISVHRMPALFFAALIPVEAIGSSGFLILVLACLCLFVLDFRKKIRKDALVSTAMTLFGLIYVSWFFSHLIKIKLLLPHGTAWAIYVLLLVKCGDAGAYFTGIRLGKTKLIEHISPNKSVEGALGGLSVTIILSLLSKIYLGYVPLFHLLVLGILVGIIAQLGDLIESFIKRDVGVKDSGHVPGLGGVLDVLDSLLLTVPFVYYYVRAFLVWDV